MKILESLTPCGSEYVDDPERCAAYIRERQEQQRRTILRLTKELFKAQEIAVDYDLLDKQIKVLAHRIENASGDYEYDMLTGLFELLCAIHEQRPFPETDEEGETP